MLKKIAYHFLRFIYMFEIDCVTIDILLCYVFKHLELFDVRTVTYLKMTFTIFLLCNVFLSVASESSTNKASQNKVVNKLLGRLKNESVAARN